MRPDAALERRLQQLPRLAPDATRAARVRARCRAQFERSQRRKHRRDTAMEFASQVLAPAAVGGVCVVYVAFLLIFAYEVGTLR